MNDVSNRLPGIALSRVALLAGAAIVAGSGLFAAAPAQAGSSYFPDRFDWQHKKPEEVGMDAAQLKVAVDAAMAEDVNIAAE